jgi:predicted amidophosphoribosyltransferase
MHRVAMDRKAREVTVKNAFAVTRPKLIEGKNVLLIDDVLTSGSTVSSCALVLKKSGAARVDVLTLARAV